MSHPRLLIAGSASGVGKTLFSSALMARLSRRGEVQGWKCGPDFIDPMLHAMATGRPGRNLDGFMMPPEAILRNFRERSSEADISIIEGVRGLYEGLDWDRDDGSTAEVAKLLRAPVILMINARSLTRSAAALVQGFRSLDPEVDIAGVVLNNISGPTHRHKASRAVEELAGVEVLGAIRRDDSLHLPFGDMGLRPLDAEEGLASLLDMGERIAEDLDVERLLEIAQSAPDLPDAPRGREHDAPGRGIRVAVPMDEAFRFYYRENLEALEALGMEVVHYRPTEGDRLPDADIHYIGGGYPDKHAQRISENGDFLEGLRSAADEGRPVISEGGGTLVLCRGLRDAQGERHPMAGVFDAEARQCARKQGLSYVIARPTPENPVFSGGDIRAHEFHYSQIQPSGGASFGYSTLRGRGIAQGMDGLVSGSALGTFMHRHALSSDGWALSILSSLRD